MYISRKAHDIDSFVIYFGIRSGSVAIGKQEAQNPRSSSWTISAPER
jgi:hypothetical protein